MSNVDLRPDDPALTLKVFHHLLFLYNQVIEAVYRARIKETKRLEEALEDDQWRYHELPMTLSVGGESITKSQLERLVRWKM